MRDRLASDLAKQDRAEEALEELEPLLEKGDGHAHSLAGILYEFGGKGLKPDYAKAKYCYELSVTSVGSVAASLGLARMFHYGKGVVVDLDRAFELYESVTEVCDDPYALMGLARLYMDERWQRVDFKRAEELACKAKTRGYIAAYSIMAQLYWKKGRWFASFITVWRGRFLYWRLSSQDDSDPRLSG